MSPYSRRANYYHHRQKDPRSFRQSSFRNVPISHTQYYGKYRREGNRAIVGYNNYTRRWEVQSILELKST